MLSVWQCVVRLNNTEICTSICKGRRISEVLCCRKNIRATRKEWPGCFIDMICCGFELTARRFMKRFQSLAASPAFFISLSTLIVIGIENRKALISASGIPS